MNRIPRTLLYAFLPAITLAILLASQSVHSAGLFTVNSTADTADASPGNGVCADSTGKCTLRAAIQEANALAGTDSIHFSIPATDAGCTGGVCVIDLQSALPDAVGFGSNTGEVCDLLRESTTVPAVATNAALGQHAFLRDPCGKGLVNGIFGLCPTTGNPKDSNTNSVDFVFVDTNATSTAAGQRLGART